MNPKWKVFIHKKWDDYGYPLDGCHKYQICANHWKTHGSSGYRWTDSNWRGGQDFLTHYYALQCFFDEHGSMEEIEKKLSKLQALEGLEDLEK